MYDALILNKGDDMTKKTIRIERRFFKNDSEWEYMLLQLGIDADYDDIGEVEFSVNVNSINTAVKN